MKKKILLLILILLITGCTSNNDKILSSEDAPDDVVLTTSDKTFSVYSENNYLYDLIGDNNVNIISENSELDTSSIGDKSISIVYEYNNKKYKKDLVYHVVDTDKPIVLSAPTYRAILVNDDVNFCGEINAIDNYDKSVSCNVVGDIDYTNPGEYDVKLDISDSSNNINERDLHVVVYDKWPSSNNSSSSSSSSTTTNHYLNFSDALSQYKTDNTEVGIDVSRWQGDIDFNQVRDAGATFVIMRISTNTDINEQMEVDSKFEQNIKNAKAAGLKVGVYVHSIAINDDMAKSDAEFVLNELNGETLDFPIAYDWESWSKLGSFGISLYDLNHAYKVFDETVKNGGYTSMLYGSEYYITNLWNIANKYPLWIANYSKKPTYQGDCILWQLSSVGRINGIYGNVDIDVYYK